MKIIILNDTHAGIRNGSEIFLNNANRFYNDLLFPYMKEHNIKHILHLGDVFDNRKFIMFKVINNYRRNFLAKLREYGMHMDVICGNHDTAYKNTNELNALKELLGHYMGEITIHMDPTVLNYDGFKIGVVPWICADNYEKSMHFIQNCKADWLGGHFEILGYDVLKGVPSHSGLESNIFHRFEQVISGHFHTKSERENILYLGSQMEFFWNDAHDPKHFHIIDTETREIEAIRNPYTLFHRIYYDDSKMNYLEYDFSQVDNKFVKIVVINKSDLFTFDRFCDMIQSRPIHELKIAENFNEFIGDNVEDEVVKIEETETLLDTYVDAVDTELNKDRLKSSIRSILTEAQALTSV